MEMAWGFLQGKECEKQVDSNRKISVIKNKFEKYLLEVKKIEIGTAHVIAVSESEESKKSGWLTAINRNSLDNLDKNNNIENVYIGVFNDGTLVGHYTIGRECFIGKFKEGALDDGRYLINKKLLEGKKEGVEYVEESN